MRYPSKVSFKGQVTIPKEVREKLGIAPGDFILFAQEGERVVLKKARVSPEEEFNKLVSILDKKVKQLGITDKDIEDAVKWARQK
ncbi:AbrB/MazE/SpoVT family DNA-binding domain-containing protein [Candidatus Aerophobetes bacterium]|nr:AbrB/MazE/SpoVT family DNA-binding domain-containing protein [Candidatus Aerophobetes bacterium]